jgi:hypothetical protein
VATAYCMWPIVQELVDEFVVVLKCSSRVFIET